MLIGFSVWLVSGNAHVFVLLSVVIVTLYRATGTQQKIWFGEVQLTSVGLYGGLISGTRLKV